MLAGAHVVEGSAVSGVLTDLRNLRCLCRFRCWSAERQFKTGQASHQKPHLLKTPKGREHVRGVKGEAHDSEERAPLEVQSVKYGNITQLKL